MAEWSIQQVARLAGTTSRALRHYAAVGLLAPSRIAGNGYRYYDEDALVRLQRILLLRELGLGLGEIGAVLDRDEPEREALTRHLAWLRHEQHRLEAQIAAVESTITARDGKEELMAEKMFDGFDHTRYREEVEERWGAEAYSRSDAWWSGMSDEERSRWKDAAADLAAAWKAAAAAGADPSGVEAQDAAERHVAWLMAIPGTPAAESGGDVGAYVRGLGDMYVADPRFAANYGGESGARFVRDALRLYAAAHL
jgi:DNA-binding transcriptional MerR regulator